MIGVLHFVLVWVVISVVLVFPIGFVLSRLGGRRFELDSVAEAMHVPREHRLIKAHVQVPVPSRPAAPRHRGPRATELDAARARRAARGGTS